MRLVNYIYMGIELRPHMKFTDQVKTIVHVG